MCVCVFADRKAQVLKALHRSTEAYSNLQRLQVHCEKTKCTEVVIREKTRLLRHGYLFAGVQLRVNTPELYLHLFFICGVEMTHLFRAAEIFHL